MHPDKTICHQCGKLVYTSPGICVICGEATPNPTVIYVPKPLESQKDIGLTLIPHLSKLDRDFPNPDDVLRFDTVDAAYG